MWQDIVLQEIYSKQSIMSYVNKNNMLYERSCCYLLAHISECYKLNVNYIRHGLLVLFVFVRTISYHKWLLKLYYLQLFTIIAYHFNACMSVL